MIMKSDDNLSLNTFNALITLNKKDTKRKYMQDYTREAKPVFKNKSKVKITLGIDDEKIKKWNAAIKAWFVDNPNIVINNLRTKNAQNKCLPLLKDLYDQFCECMDSNNNKAKKAYKNSLWFILKKWISNRNWHPRQKLQKTKQEY